jgi:nitrite reductase (cytochrome c-552)
MKTIREITERKPWLNWVIFFATVIIVFLLGMLASSVVERRSESQLYFQMVSPIPDWEPDNTVWGRIFRANTKHISKRLTPHSGANMQDMP